jgi:hypothetical protein
VYVKAANPAAGDQFGWRVTMSVDGSTLAVSAPFAGGSGAVYVFGNTGTAITGPQWHQEAMLKASNPGSGDQFGSSIALSADGSILAVGAQSEDSAATGINGNQGDNSASAAGAVYLFSRSGTSWGQAAYLKASNTNAGDGFGASVALSADGATLAVGALFEASAATGIDGNQADNSAARAGAVYLFSYSGVAWSQQAYIKASNTGSGDNFGASVALSEDGAFLAAGAPGEKSRATGIDGDQADNSLNTAGAVYTFTRSATGWTQQAYVKASNTGSGDSFGTSIALSADGSTMAIGAATENSAATGINGNQADDFGIVSGAVYVLVQSAGIWTQQAYVKASNTGTVDEFGFSVALSEDGSTLAVGALLEDSAATGINGNQSDNSARDAGAAYSFTRSGTVWTQLAYVKASNTDAGDQFGRAVALSGDGTILAIGAASEASSSPGIGGNQSNNAASGAGAVYLYE